MTPPRQPSVAPAPAKRVGCPLLDGDLDRWLPCCAGRFLPLARREAGDDDAAYDALQQSWAIALEKLHQYDGKSPACGWVRAIVHSQALRGKFRRSREAPLTDGNEAGATLRGLRPTGVVRDSPEAAAYARELTHLLMEVIEKLPPAFRDVVRLRDLEERSPQEVAHRLRISTLNVAVRLHRAHKLLRRRLQARIAGSTAAARTGERRSSAKTSALNLS